MKIPLWLRIVLWSLVAVLGALAIGVLAWSRGEPVNALWMVVATGCVFAVSYRFHSAWLMAKVLTLDEQRATSRQPEDPVRPGGIAQDLELRTDEPQVLPGEVDDLELDRVFEDVDHRDFMSSIA